MQQIFTTETEGKTLIIVAHRPVSSFAVADVRAELDALTPELQRAEVKGVVLDLEEMPYFGTHMLEAMHLIGRPIRARGGKMALCNVSDVGHEILRTARFDSLWPICPSRQEALQAVAE